MFPRLRDADAGCALGFEDLFVFVVCADPKPDDGVAVHDSEGTITDVDPGGPESFDLFKPEGAVLGVCGPEAVLLAGPLLDFGWKLLVGRPELGRGPTFHRPGVGGSCRSGVRRGLLPQARRACLP